MIDIKAMFDYNADTGELVRKTNMSSKAKIGSVIGYYDCPHEAHEAYLQAKRKYHEGCTI